MRAALESESRENMPGVLSPKRERDDAEETILQSPRKRFKLSELPVTQAQHSAINSILHAFKKKGEFDAIRKSSYTKFEDGESKGQLVDNLTSLADRELDNNPSLLSKNRRQTAPLIEGKAERTDMYKSAEEAIDYFVGLDLAGVENKLREIRRKDVGDTVADEEQKRGEKSDEDYARESMARRAVWAKEREQEEEEQRKRDEEERRQREAQDEIKRQEAEKEKQRKLEHERERQDYLERKKRQDAEWEAERLEAEAKEKKKREKEHEKAIEDAALDELIREGKRMAAKSARLEFTDSPKHVAPVTGSRKESALAAIMRAEKQEKESGVPSQAVSESGQEAIDKDEAHVEVERKQPILKYGHTGSSIAPPRSDYSHRRPHDQYYDKRSNPDHSHSYDSRSSHHYDDRRHERRHYDERGHDNGYPSEETLEAAFYPGSSHRAPHDRQYDRRSSQKYGESYDGYESSRRPDGDRYGEQERQSSVSGSRYGKEDSHDRHHRRDDSRSKESPETRKHPVYKKESSPSSMLPPPKSGREDRSKEVEKTDSIAGDDRSARHSPSSSRRESYHESSRRDHNEPATKSRKRSRSREREGIDRYVPSSTKRDDTRDRERRDSRDYESSKYKEAEKKYGHDEDFRKDRHHESARHSERERESGRDRDYDGAGDYRRSRDSYDRDYRTDRHKDDRREEERYHKDTARHHESDRDGRRSSRRDSGGDDRHHHHHQSSYTRAK